VTELMPRTVATDIEAAMTALDELVDAGDYEAIAWNLLDLKATKRLLDDLTRETERWLAEIAPWSGGTLEVDGLPMLERKQGADRKRWRWDELRPILRRRVLDPEGTGEFDQERAALVDEVMDLMFDVAPLTGSTGPRVTPLKPILAAAGRDLDEFCEAQPGRVSVVIHEATK
jgi:hypothetical protein